MSLLNRQRILKRWGPRRPDTVLRLLVVDLDAGRAAAAAAVFAARPEVAVAQGDVLACQAQALVCPANSFGDMGGGVDRAVDGFFGGEAQGRLQELIRTQFAGELPVGLAHVLRMRPGNLGALVAAPTMREPGKVAGTLNAYLAMRAAVLAVLQHNARCELAGDHEGRILTLATPLLATGLGGMPTDTALVQMRTALEALLDGRGPAARHALEAPYPVGPAGRPWASDARAGAEGVDGADGVDGEGVP